MDPVELEIMQQDAHYVRAACTRRAAKPRPCNVSTGDGAKPVRKRNTQNATLDREGRLRVARNIEKVFDCCDAAPTGHAIGNAVHRVVKSRARRATTVQCRKVFAREYENGTLAG
jgi:hypothetical protein